MIINFKDFNNKKKYDYVINGCGIAGFTCAFFLKKFKKKSKILVIESGHLNAKYSDNFKGKVFGDPYIKLFKHRLEGLFGTSSLWAGWCRVLEEFDFKKKKILNIDWPIKKHDLDQYLNAALRFLKVDSLRNASFRKKIDKNFFLIKFSWSSLRFSKFKRTYIESLTKKNNLDVLYESSLVQIKTLEKKVKSIIVQNPNTFEKKEIYSSNFILALGGLENNRVLLWHNLKNKNKIGNRNILGRYFIEHPHFKMGNISIKKINFFNKMIYDKKRRMVFFSPTEFFLKKNKILNFSVRLRETRNGFIYKLINKMIGIRFFHKIILKYNVALSDFGLVIEQYPKRQNYISLDIKNKDIFGVPKLKLHFRKCKIDFKTLDLASRQFKKFIEQNKIGSVKLNNQWLFNKKISEPSKSAMGYYYVGHFQGGTRMAKNSKIGIVDKNLKVFGKNNLYILGSSVFPTCGHANPTLTITQLAIRLAKYLSKKK